MKITKRQLRSIIKEELELQQSNHTLLSEGLMSTLGKLTSGGMQKIKETIAKKVMSIMGIDTKSIMSKAFINFFGNLEIEDIKDMLIGDNKCVTATGELAAAVTETIVEELPELLGVSTEGAFRGALQETLSTAFTEKFNDQLAGAL